MISKQAVSFLSLFITKNEKKQAGNAQFGNNAKPSACGWQSSVPLRLCVKFKKGLNHGFHGHCRFATTT
jgi:hypothetical protein